MLGKDYFYNGSIRNYVATFGKLFSDIEINNKTSQGQDNLIKAPIHYGDKSKIHDYIFNNSNKAVSLPRMGFDFVIDGVDDQRRTHRLNTHTFKTDRDTNTSDWSFNTVPYNFTFNLNVFSSDITDGLQIIEQILPHFQPSLTVKIKPFPDEYPDVVTDVVITLRDVANSFETNGGVSDKDYYTWDLSFSLQGVLFSQVTANESIILDITGVNLFEFETKEKNP